MKSAILAFFLLPLCATLAADTIAPVDRESMSEVDEVFSRRALGREDRGLPQRAPQISYPSVHRTPNPIDNSVSQEARRLREAPRGPHQDFDKQMSAARRKADPGSLGDGKSGRGNTIENSGDSSALGVGQVHPPVRLRPTLYGKDPGH